MQKPNSKKKEKPSMVSCVLIAIGIFAGAIVIAVATNAILTSNFLALTENQANMASMFVESAVGAIAAGFVLYQLRKEEIVDRRENQLHEAEFYQHFINYWLEADKLFIEHPECRKYFYENASIKHISPLSNEFQIIMAFSEYFDDLFVYSLTEVENQSQEHSAIPKDQITSYKLYMDRIKCSEAYKVYRERYEWINSTKKSRRRRDGD